VATDKTCTACDKYIFHCGMFFVSK
jgi:hypothetical protein